MSAAILAFLRPEAAFAPLVSDAAVVTLACVAALDGSALARVWRGHVNDYGIGNDLRTRSVQSPDAGPYRVPPARNEVVGNRRQALRMVGVVICIDAILLAVSLVLRFRVGP